MTEDKDKKPPTTPILVIRFAGPTSAAFSLGGAGTVSPEQLAIAGEFLLCQARLIWQQQFAEAVAQRKRQQIIVPEMGGK